MAGKLFNIYSGNTGGVLSTSTAKVGSFGTTSDDFYSVNFDTGRKSIWTNNIEFGRAADWGNISGIPSWIGSDGVTWAKVKDKPDTATRWPYWSEILSKPTAVGSATQPIYWDGSTFQLVNSVAPANHDHDARYVKLDGTNVMSGDLTLKLADLDRFIVFSYPNAVNPSSNSWRTGVLGTGSGENNFFVVQYQRINTNSSDWNTAFKIGQDTGTVTFTNNIKVGSYTVYHSGNLPAYPTVNNGALYLQANGTTKVTFTANQSSNLTFNIAPGSSNGTISVGGTDVAVKGLGNNAYSSTDYLPLAGGTMDDNAQIKRKGKGGSWISGRDNALIRETSSSGYHPLFSLKTKDGSWELGEYNTSGWYNIPVFSYITDTNYNSGNNSATYQIKYPLASGTIALTADLTWSKIADKPATATRWPSWDEVTSKPSVFPAADHNHDSRYPRKFSYTLPSQKGVRISYSSDATVLVSVCGSNSGAQLVIIGTGYGEGGRIRNQFTELVSCNLFDWSIPNSNSISCSVEIFSNKDSNSTVLVISTDNITFTEINALTSPKENATLLNSSNYTTYTVKKDGTGATGTWGINISGNATSATKWQNARTLTIGNTGKSVDGTGNVSWSLSEIGAASSGHNHDDKYLKLSGGTLTGVLHLLSSQYADTAGTGALDLANSDIYGVNSIKFADLSDSAGEGLQWYRDATHVDSIWVKNGVIYFSPNRTWGGSVTNNTVYHSGNLTAATLLGSTAKGNTSKPIYWDGSKIVECLAYSQASVNYANSAGSVDWSNVQNKPSTFTPSAHDHTYLKKNFKSTGITNIPFTGEQFEYGILTGAATGVASPENLTAFDSYSQVEYINLPWYSNLYGGQLMFGANSGKIGYRTIHNGTWTLIKEIIHSDNYTTYTVKKDGTGATGTWGISITGNAGSADKLKTARTITINGSSKSFDGTGNISWSLADLNLPSNEHNHDDRYVKKSGDTMTGPLVINSSVNNSYNEGLRITRAANNWAGITFGSTGASGAPTDGWFAATNPEKEFIISPDTSAKTTGLTLIKGGDLKWRNNKVWHAGNDGTGSGLDADLLDGVHANGLFTNFSNKTVSGNKVLAATIGGKELTVSVEYANSSNTANSATTATVLLTNNTSQNADSCYTGAPGLRFWRYNGTSSTTGQSGGDGWILSWSWNQGSVGGQIYLDDNPSKTMCIRGFNNSDSTFTTWAKILHTDNISPSLPISGNTIAVTVGGVTSSYITVPYATSAGNADKLDTFHAADLFQTFTNDATTNAVKIKIGNTEKSLVVGYATKANSATSATEAAKLNGVTSQNVNECAENLKLRFYFNLNHNNGYCGSSNSYGFPSSNNANAILWLPTHQSTYGGQLGISSNGSLYYRFITAGSFPTTANGGSWNRILTSGNSSVSKSGETLSVKINGTTQSLTNTWRGITDSYNVDSPSSSTSLSQKGAKALYSALINGYANNAGNADTLDNHDSTYFHIHTARSYTSVDALPSGSEGWYNIFTLSDNSDGAVICTIKAYAHSSLTFIASKGYSTGATLQILQYNSSSNGSYFYVKGVRIVEGGKVQALFNKTSGISSYISVNINIFSSHGTLRPNTTLTLETGSPTVIAGPLNGTNGKITSDIVGNITGKAGSADSVPWSGITGKAVSKTAWGQTFVDASGNIQSISGNMTSVGQVTPDGNATRSNGTSSANWANVYTRNIISGDHLTLRSGTSKDIIFQTNAGTEYMRLTSGGNLGIGTNSPAYKLHVKGSQKIEGGSLGIYPVGGNYNDGIRIHARSADNTWAAITFCASDNTGDTGISANSWFVGNNSGNFYITRNGSSSSSSAILYCSSNKWYINTTSGSEILNVGGWIGTVGNVGWYSITHGGGWYMDNSTYVKSYNSKSVYTAGGMYGNGFYHIGNQSNDYVILANGGAKQWSASKVASTIVARTGDNYIYNGYYNSDISNEDSLTPGSVYFAQSNEGWIRKQSIGTFADNLRSNEIITITKDLTVTEAWKDTGIIMNTTTFPRGTGTYAIQIVSNTAGTDGYYPYYSGIMSIYTSTTNGGLADEVPLHCIGHSNDGDARRIYIRTIEGNGNTNGKIQIAGATTLSSHTYTFKFRKLI